MAPKRACLQHIYNTGVNLAWAQVSTQNNYNAADVRAALERARGHADAARFFDNPQVGIDLAIARLNQFGVGPQALDASEAALFHLQGQLREFCCTVRV